MPWYIWLLMFVVLGSIVGGLLLLRSAKQPPLSAEQLAKIRSRQLEQEAKDAKDARER